MRIAYGKLLGLSLRHTYYASGESRGDFELRPSPSTQELLARSGLVFRATESGGALFGRIVPESTPRELEPEVPLPLRVQLLLYARSARVEALTALPQRALAGSVFYWNNLRDDRLGERLLLGDSVASTRLGPPATLVTRTLMYPFDAPTQAASIVLSDVFGAQRHTASFALEGDDRVSEHAIDLAQLALPRGLYTVTHTPNPPANPKRFYYDPDLGLRPPFGVIELWSSTLPDTDAERVPTDYRFVQGRTLTPRDYHLQLEARSATWRYTVIKKYEGNGASLGSLQVVGPIAFNRTDLAGRAVFDSNAPQVLREVPSELRLRYGEPPAELPLAQPSADTPLQRGVAGGPHIAELFVYV